MTLIEDAIKGLNLALNDAKMEVVILDKALALLSGMHKERNNSHEGEASGPIKHSKSGFVGVYPVGRASKKFYACVTENKVTKRLPRTYDTAEQANTARSEYLAKRDGEPKRSTANKRTFGPSNEAKV